jgi:hypothetical protein
MPPTPKQTPTPAANNGTSVLTEALRLHKQGYAVVPCGGKKPTVRGWGERRLTPAELRGALAGPHLNIAIALNQSDLIDAECDTLEAETALQTMFGGRSVGWSLFPF